MGTMLLLRSFCALSASFLVGSSVRFVLNGFVEGDDEEVDDTDDECPKIFLVVIST